MGSSPTEMTFFKKNLSNALAALVPYVETTWPITYIFEDKNIIGRNDYALLSIRDPQVSRIHTIIERTSENKFVICDKSARGTFVNGKQLVKHKVEDLHHNDIIRFSPVDRFTYTFRLNKKLFPDQDDTVSVAVDDQRSKLNDSHSAEMQKLNNDIEKIQIEKSGLQDEMNKRLTVQENTFQEERLSLSRLITATKEQKDEAERKLKEMEENVNEQNNKLRSDVESKMEEITRKGFELQQLKEEMEARHQREREDLEKRCKAEISELKEQLAESEMEQGRLQGETRKVEKKLEETKITLQKYELEQQRIVEEKINVETKLESTIVDLTNERSTSDEKVRELKRKLQEAHEQHRKDIEGLEEQLQCSICVELFVDPCVLNCGHIFCKQCIDEWKKKKKICPMCRTKVTHSTRIYHLDSIIDKNVGLLSNEAQKRRESMIVLRTKGKCPLPAKKRKHALPVEGQDLTHSSDQGAGPRPAQEAGPSSALAAGPSSAQGTAHSSAQIAGPSSAQGAAHSSAPSLVHSSAQNIPFPFHHIQSAPSSFGEPVNHLHLISMTAPSNLEDPFTWNQHGRHMRHRTANSFDQVLDLTHVIGPPVTVAAIDLTDLDWPQPSVSGATLAAPPSPNTTIDLTSP